MLGELFFLQLVTSDENHRQKTVLRGQVARDSLCAHKEHVETNGFLQTSLVDDFLLFYTGQNHVTVANLREKA